MKKFSSLIVLFLACHLMSAQSESVTKNFVAGGSFNFSIQNNTVPNGLFFNNGFVGPIVSGYNRDRKSTHFSFEPYFGKQVSSHWLLGLQLGYSLDRYTSESAGIIFPGQLDTFTFKQNDDTYAVGLFGRYSFNPENKFVIFAQPSVQTAFQQQEDFRDGEDAGGVEAFSIAIGASVGVLYELNETFRISSRLGGLGFQTGHWSNIDSDHKTSFSAFSTNFNLTSFYFGFEFKF